MSFSSGTFTFTSNTFAPSPVTGTTISSTDAQSTWSEIATALSTCLLKDGSQTATSSVPFAVGISVTTGITTASTTFALVNTTATTVNFAGAATTLNIGNTSGVTVGLGTWSLPIAQNSQSTAYTTVLADAGRHILHPTADNNARTFTIDSNANVAYPVGTAITFVNQINTLTIAITSDTMTLAGAGTTGSRTLAANGIATALKVASTAWIISGTGLT